MNNPILKDIAKFGASFACGALIEYFAPRILLPSVIGLEIFIVNELHHENYDNMPILAGFLTGAGLLLLPKHHQSLITYHVMDD